MPKNRDYTGLEITPSSMAWLIRQRSVTQGLVDKRRRMLEEIPREIVELEQKIAALDQVIKMHEVKVEPQQIKGKRPKNPPLTPYGVMTKAILRCLREAGSEPRYTSEIAMYVARVANLDLTQVRKETLVKQVSWRLKALRRDGFLKGHHPVGRGLRVEGQWSLADAVLDQSQLKVA